MQISFEDAILKLAITDGVGNIINIPGIWEVLSEHYNNEAIEMMEESREHPCALCNAEVEDGYESHLDDGRLVCDACAWEDSDEEDDED